MNDQTIQVIFSGIGLVVWLIRLEGKVLAAEKSNIETQKDVDELRIDHSKIAEDLARIRESLARIEGGLLSARKRQENE